MFLMRGHCPRIWVCPLAHFFGAKPKLSIIPLFFLRKVYKRKSGFLANLVTKRYLWARKHPKTGLFGPFQGVFAPNLCPLLISLLAILPTFFGHFIRNLGTNAHNFFSKVGKPAISGHELFASVPLSPPLIDQPEAKHCSPDDDTHRPATY